MEIMEIVNFRLDYNDGGERGFPMITANPQSGALSLSSAPEPVIATECRPPGAGSREGLWQAAIFVAAVLVYTVMAFALHKDESVWDEWRYVGTAENMLQGFFIDAKEPHIVGGPGYPLVLMPFLATDVSLVWARVLNGVFVGLAGVLIFQVVRHYSGRWWALAAALMVAFHPNLARTTPTLMTEALSMFQIAAFLWLFTRALRTGRMSAVWVILSAICLGWLAMTRMIFGHVILAMIVFSVAGLAFWKSQRAAMARTVVTMVLAFACCVPYLLHTRKLTGQFPCWTTTSGELLYWFTSHYPGENGHWFGDDEAMSFPELAPNHKALFERVRKMHILERNEALMAAAKENIRSAPLAVANNWVCNVSRLLFGFPRSFQKEEIITILLVAFNGPLLLLLAGALGLWAFRRSSMPVEIAVLALLAFVYLGGASLASSLPRYLLPVLPIFWLVAGVEYQRNVRVQILK